MTTNSVTDWTKPASDNRSSEPVDYAALRTAHYDGTLGLLLLNLTPDARFETACNHAARIERSVDDVLDLYEQSMRDYTRLQMLAEIEQRIDDEEAAQ